MLDLVRELADEHRVAVGVVLHDLDQAAAVADELLLMHEGSVRACGHPTEVLTPEQLSRTYGIRVEVDVDPLTGTLRTRAVGRRAARTALPAARS
jgi:ferric hydroxamate transport system ATP-binding protein